VSYVAVLDCDELGPGTFTCDSVSVPSNENIKSNTSLMRRRGSVGTNSDIASKSGSFVSLANTREAKKVPAT
jgi:hypothetical protein